MKLQNLTETDRWKINMEKGLNGKVALIDIERTDGRSGSNKLSLSTDTWDEILGLMTALDPFVQKIKEQAATGNV